MRGSTLPCRCRGGMRHSIVVAFMGLVLGPVALWGTIFSTVRGIVHDPSHRPVSGAAVTLRAMHSQYIQETSTQDDGSFAFPSVPAGEYILNVKHPGFAEEEQPLVIVSSTAPVLHFALQLARRTESVVVAETPEAVNPQSMTPSTLIDRQEIARTPGADLTNSLNMITGYVPGAYVTHDQLHIRGGHQVTW